MTIFSPLPASIFIFSLKNLSFFGDISSTEKSALF